MGPIDVGKKKIAAQVAQRIYGHFLAFPFFNKRSPTSLGLFDNITNNPSLLESNPQWWTHLYVAHLYEQMDVIKGMLEQMPVVITNYTLSFRIWSMAMGVDMCQFYRGYTVGLPQPNLAYLLTGEPRDDPDNMPTNFSYPFQMRIGKGMQSVKDKRIIKVDVSKSPYPTVVIGRTSKAIAIDIGKRWGIDVDSADFSLPNAFSGKI